MSGDAEKRTRPPSIGEYLWAELRQAFQDVRQKVIEEGWFGRVVTAAPVVEVDHALSQERDSLYGDDHQPSKTGPETSIELRPSFEEQWAPVERPAQPLGQEHSGIDLDR